MHHEINTLSESEGKGFLFGLFLEGLEEILN